MSELTFGMRLTYDGKAAAAGLDETKAKLDGVASSSSKLATQYTGLNQGVKQHGTEVKETEASVRKLLDRYDPLGAKLRQLQDDFKKLNASAAGGKIAGGDDARTDLVYANLQKQITLASTAQNGYATATTNAARSAGQLRMANQQLPMQFTDIWVSLAAGQNPMMVMLQQGTQIKDSFGGIGPALRAMGGYMRGLVNPVTLVTGALIAGGVAWYNWGESAQEAMDKASARLKEAEKDARAAAAGRQRTTAEQIKALEGQRDGATGQLEAAQKRLAGVKRETDSRLALEIGSEVERRKQAVFDLNVQIADLKKRQAEEESKPANKKEKQDTSFLASMQRESDIYGMTAGQIKIYEAAKRGITGVQMEQVIALAEEKDAQDAATESAKANAKAIAEANRILSNVDPLYKANAEWAKLVDLQARGLITTEQMGLDYAKSFKDVEKQGSDSFAELSRIIDGWGKKAAGAFVDFAFDGKGSISDLVSHMIREFATMQAYQSMFKPLFGAGGDWVSGLFGMGGGRASGGPVSANTIYEVNENGPELLNQGGKDYLMMGGKGGFVKPLGQGVSAQGRSAAAPNVVIQLNNQSGTNLNAKQHGAPQFDGRNWVMGIVLEAIDSDPQFRNALGVGS